MRRCQSPRQKMMKGSWLLRRCQSPTLPTKNLINQLDLVSTAQKTDGTPRGEHRERVEQNVAQDLFMDGPRLWQVVLFEKKTRDFCSSLT